MTCKPSRVWRTAPTLHPIQEGFFQEHGLQCGFCTPGMMMTVVALLEKNQDPSELEIREAISGNLCRCTGLRQHRPLGAARGEDHARGGSGTGAGRRRTAEDRQMAAPTTRKNSAATGKASSARKIRGFCAARATMSTTSNSPACSTWTSLAVRSRTQGSRTSRPNRRSTSRASWPSSPARISTRRGWPGCRR